MAICVFKRLPARLGTMSATGLPRLVIVKDSPDSTRRRISGSLVFASYEPISSCMIKHRNDFVDQYTGLYCDHQANRPSNWSIQLATRSVPIAGGASARGCVTRAGNSRAPDGGHGAGAGAFPGLEGVRSNSAIAPAGVYEIVEEDNRPRL